MALASATAFVLLGVASSLLVLLVASTIGAVAQANANPATNKLIAEDLPSGSQGIVTGIKQSGVQAFVFVGGAIVPAMALTWGRWSAYMLFAVFAVGLAAVAWIFLPRATADDGVAWVRDSSRLPSDIWWITAYGFLLGFGGSVTVLYALFTTERLGQSVVVGGAVVAVVGITAMPARIAWAHYAERRHAYRLSLIVIALLAIALNELGVPAVSLTGAQMGIVTDQQHGKAKVRTVSTDRIKQELSAGNVVVGAGGHMHRYFNQNSSVTLKPIDHMLSIDFDLCTSSSCLKSSNVCDHNQSLFTKLGFDTAQIQFLSAQPRNIEFLCNNSFLHYRGGSNWDAKSKKYITKKTLLVRSYIENILAT